MEMGKVFNDNTHVLRDEFKGRKIIIEPGKAIDMDYFEYIDFKGMPPVGFTIRDWFDGSGNQKPETFKRLRYEGPMPHESKGDIVCAACGDKFASNTQLDLHIDMTHLDSMEDKDVADKRRSKRKG